MKAKVKRTGQIVEVLTAFDHRGGAPAIVYEVLGHPEIKYRPEELEFYVTFDYIEEVVSEIQAVNIGYWEKLEHQFAGMAMQGMIRTVGHDRMYPPEKIAIYAAACAYALVEKLKEERYGHKEDKEQKEIV